MPSKTPAIELRNAILRREDLLGASITNHMIERLQKSGIELSNDQESYHLHEIKECLADIFGIEATEILIEKIRKDLAK